MGKVDMSLGGELAKGCCIEAEGEKGRSEIAARESDLIAEVQEWQVARGGGS